MLCNGCGNDSASRVRVGFWETEDKNREQYEYCNRCGEVGSANLPDVFFDGKPCQNLCGADGRPMEFTSKGHKAKYLKEHNLSEAGDKIHGAPIDYTKRLHKQQSRESIRSEIKDAIQKGHMDFKYGRKYA